MSKSKRLGRGLDALLGSHGNPGGRQKGSYSDISVSALIPGKLQPRQAIGDDALAELADSIREQGILQPLLVRPISGSVSGSRLVSHEIVAGERRWRAAQLAGLKVVPVVVHSLDDKDALAVALIENLQRENLTPIEIAESFKKLVEDFGMTHEEVGETVGRSRSAVSNFLRLLDLVGIARENLANGQLSMGHARALVTLDLAEQQRLTEKIVAENLSVRDVEKVVAASAAANDVESRAGKSPIDLQTKWLQQQLTKELGSKVSIKAGKGRGGNLGIRFDNLEQLQEALLKVEKLVGQVRETAGPRADA